MIIYRHHHQLDAPGPTTGDSSRFQAASPLWQCGCHCACGCSSAPVAMWRFLAPVCGSVAALAKGGKSCEKIFFAALTILVSICWMFTRAKIGMHIVYFGRGEPSISTTASGSILLNFLFDKMFISNQINSQHEQFRVLFRVPLHPSYT